MAYMYSNSQDSIIFYDLIGVTKLKKAKDQH